MSIPLPDYSVGINGKAASQLADLHSIRADLADARDYARLYASRVPSPDAQTAADPVSSAINRALWASACISYRRVFTTGKAHLAKGQPRLRVNDNWTDNLTPEQLDAHNSVLDMANRHIAHRVNDLEQVKIFALLASPPAQPGIVGVGPMILSMVGPEVTLPQRLVSVCDLLIAATEREIDKLSQVLLDFMREQDLDPMYAAVQSRARLNDSEESSEMPRDD